MGYPLSQLGKKKYFLFQVTYGISAAPKLHFQRGEKLLGAFLHGDLHA